MILAGFAKTMCALCPGSKLLQARFDYAAPDYASEYTRVLEVQVCFEQPYSEIVFERTLLHVALPRADPEVYQALTAIAERRLRLATKRASYTAAVRELMLQQIPKRMRMSESARSLGLSERSLRRRLDAEGTTFRLVECSAFGLHSKWMLGDRNLTIQEAAYELGYSDTSAFHRAFKRWTGMTPTAYRETSRRDPRP